MRADTRSDPAQDAYGPDAHFVQTNPRASALLVPATREFEAQHWRDVAYFEPFYLKDFVATVSRKKLF